jgi:hypothetical protein
MKKLKLVSSLMAILMAFTLLYSCEEEGANPTLTDTELIAAIQTASKVNIDASELPSSAATVVTNDFSESFVADAQVAATLGFQVTLIRERGSRVGESESAFFDITGRELNAGDSTRRQRRDERGRKKRGPQQRDCFDFVFPISLTVADGTAFTLASQEDFSQVKEWYQANPDNREHPEFVFPLDISFGGEVMTINNMEELQDARGLCQEDRSRGKCFELVFPITVVMPDASEIILNSREDRRQIRAWYEENPDAEDKPTVVFPIDITYEDGTTVTINSEEELIAAKEGC